MMKGEPWSRSERWLLAALGILAVALRWWHVGRMAASPYFAEPVMDPGFHSDWARKFAAGETFLDGPFFRAPLYPWFLGSLYRVFGDFYGPRLVQGLLGGGTTVLVYLLGRQLFGRLAAGVAGALAATYWVLIYFDGELLIPALYVPLLLGGLLGCVRWGQGAGTGSLLAGGLLLGLAAIARPNVLLFLPLLALWCAYRDGHRNLRAGLVFGLAVLAPILPITITNRVIGGEWVLISSQAGVNLWIGNNPASDGSTAIVPGTPGGWWEGFHAARQMAESEAGRELSDAEISQHYTGKALGWATAEPGAFLSHLAWKLRLFWTDWELGNNQEIRFFAQRFNPLVRLSVPFAVLAGLGLVGMAMAAYRQRWTSFPVWGFALVYTASVVLFFVCSRFRVPVLPALMIFAGHACALAFTACRERRYGRMASMLLPALAIGLLTRVLPAALVASDANGFGQLALAEQRAGRHVEALELFEAGLGADPNHRYLRPWMAQSLLEMGEPGRALRLCEETLEDFPDQPEALDVWLEAKYRQQDFGSMVQRARAVLERSPGLAQVRYQLGRALFASGQPADALVEFRRVREEDPSSFNAPFAMGVVLRAAGEAAAAREAFAAALKNAARANSDYVAEAQAALESLGG